MLTHEQIWTAIDRLAEGCGYSTSGLARRAGLDPTTFNRSKRFTPDGKERWPSTESISKILATASIPLTDFLSLVDPDLDRPNLLHLQTARLDDAEKDINFLKNGTPSPGWRHLPFPFQIREEMEQNGVFGLELTHPIPGLPHRPGAIVLAARQAALHQGDLVIACLKGAKGLVLGTYTVRSEYHSGDALFIQAETDQSARTLPVQELDWLARLIWISL